MLSAVAAAKQLPQLSLLDALYFVVVTVATVGYGDITPAHVPGKVIMLLEVTTAFSTVIFLLSDFTSIKESMRRK